ncbi:hypothetical protein LTR09_007847 [Extremus antarcticus]|uniref:Uncharacterized protein n=1 Tax=Extremus antarcticus TaxID=702011 RepID=A0AAJ0DC28_9PEZI|nr:hypothetical protein LTR09_007847 [Extremus antarcticus]
MDNNQPPITDLDRKVHNPVISLVDWFCENLVAMTFMSVLGIITHILSAAPRCGMRAVQRRFWDWMPQMIFMVLLCMAIRAPTASASSTATGIVATRGAPMETVPAMPKADQQSLLWATVGILVAVFFFVFVAVGICCCVGNKWKAQTGYDNCKKWTKAGISCINAVYAWAMSKLPMGEASSTDTGISDTRGSAMPTQSASNNS